MSFHDEHWLVFGGRPSSIASSSSPVVVGCHCGFEADLEADCGWGNSVVVHLISEARLDVLREGEAIARGMVQQVRREALTEASEAIEAALLCEGGDCETCEDIREAARVVRALGSES